ncbi:hypothetical protein M9Y10_008310 [Tritrichomonas musculus]|uniref:Uncharacterized protein n=1 Tax=Tritrichomonas musculus TaxID=1915356 RepID=A0ABR2IYV6_9EUKA
MPPKKVPARKQSEILEEEAKKMESIMSMLRGQIEEERAKVQPSGQRWAAAAEGPMGRFDSHGKLARQILSKKPPKKQGSESSQSSTRSTPRPQSEKTSESGGNGRVISTTSSSSLSAKTRKPPTTKTKKGKIDVVVEPQGGKLWGTYMADSSVQPDEGSGGALWGNRNTDTSVQPDGPPTGGSLWGPHPDEQADNLKFQEELQRIRSSSRNSTKTSTATSAASSSTSTEVKTSNNDPDLPPIGAGGALWGPPPDEQLEQQKFQREIARFRGEPVPPPPSAKVDNESTAVGGNLIQKKTINPSGFTYFDRLVTKDILSGEPVIQQQKNK